MSVYACCNAIITTHLKQLLHAFNTSNAFFAYLLLQRPLEALNFIYIFSKKKRPFKHPRQRVWVLCKYKFQLSSFVRVLHWIYAPFGSTEPYDTYNHAAISSQSRPISRRSENVIEVINKLNKFHKCVAQLRVRITDIDIHTCMYNCMDKTKHKTKTTTTTTTKKNAATMARTVYSYIRRDHIIVKWAFTLNVWILDSVFY